VNSAVVAAPSAHKPRVDALEQRDQASQLSQPVIPSQAQSVYVTPPDAEAQAAPIPTQLKVEQVTRTASPGRSAGVVPVQSNRRLLRESPNASGMMLANQESGILVFSPDPQIFWIVGPAGMIQYSSNGGGAVISQNSGVLADLLAGSAPSPVVCWIVGRAGTILRTTDAEHWSKVGAPGDQDWIGVRATDGLHAIIWDKDNHTYSTADGGKRWESVSR
jgi:hypothetical protein